MNDMIKLKRATKGQLVKADVTGIGDWVVGHIKSFDKTFIIFAPSDGSEDVKIVRGEVYKATEAEFNEFHKEMEVQKAASIDWADVLKNGDIHDHNCPHCNVSLDNGISVDGDREDNRHDKYLICCLGCGEEFGPAIARSSIPTRNYKYEDCVCASGRKSKDKGDDVALLLRGKDLDFVYKKASEILEVSIKSLKIKYNHLNPGQQRMCLGNRIRKIYSPK